MNADRVRRLKRVLEHQEQVLTQTKAREAEMDRATRAVFEWIQRADIAARSARR